MFDSHLHLHDPRLSPVLNSVIQSAAVSAICNCATSPADWDSVATLAQRHLPFKVIPAFGVHPWYIDNLPDNWQSQLEKLLLHFPHAAVGEAGLDRVKRDTPLTTQLPILTAQLELASRHNRPISLHGARAWDQLADALAPYAHRLPAIICHGFGGSLESMQRLLNLGAYISIAGTVCNPKATRVRTAATTLPLDRLLIETDSPDLFPQGGIPANPPNSPSNARPLNQPANLYLIAATIATLRHCHTATITTATTANAWQALTPPSP